MMATRQEMKQRVAKHQQQWREQNDLIATMRAEGMSAAGIAHRLLLSERTIQRRLHTLGLTTPPPPPFTEDELLRAKQLLEDGATYVDAAKAIGRSAWGLGMRLPGYAKTPRQRQRKPDGSWT